MTQKKPLSQMTNEELWQLFPIILREHNPHYGEWYDEERARLAGLGLPIRRISHIGSTAVAGLIAKPTVDILLETDSSPETLTEKIKKAGWLLMAKNTLPSGYVFNKGYTPDGFAERVFHLHLRRYGDWDELYFRDYLTAHADAAEEYAELKLRLAALWRHNRDAYTEAKSELVKKYTALARAEFAGRYLPFDTDSK